MISQQYDSNICKKKRKSVEQYRIVIGSSLFVDVDYRSGFEGVDTMSEKEQYIADVSTKQADFGYHLGGVPEDNASVVHPHIPNIASRETWIFPS